MNLIYKYEFNGQTYTVCPDAKALTSDENGVMFIGEDTYQTLLGMTDEEATACHAEGLLNQLRCKRDYLLQETDWWCCSDQTPTQAQLNYRTALRNLPSTAEPQLDTEENLTNVTWPTKPE